MRVAHVITRLILGGAQENTVLCCEDLMRRHGDDVLLMTGPPLGPEGSLLGAGKGRGGAAGNHRRSSAGPSIPGATLVELLTDQRGDCAAFGPTWCIRTAPRAECSAGPPPGRWACRP